MANSTFFSDMMTFMDQNLGENLFQAAGNLISGIAPLFSALFGIYLLMIVFSYWSGGGMTEMAVDLFKRMIVWSFLIALAFNAGHYSELANIIYGLDSDLTGILGQQAYSGNTIDQQMDKINAVTNKVYAEYEDLGFWDALGRSIEYLMVIWGVKIFAGFLTSVCFGLYLVAKSCLALTLMIGPLFIACALFPQTRQYAMNWAGQCANFVFACVLLGIAGTLEIQFIDSLITTMRPQDNFGMASAFMAILFFATIVFIILVWNIPQIAAALTGGASTSGHARGIGGLARGGAATGKMAGKAYSSARKFFGSNSMKG